MQIRSPSHQMPSVQVPKRHPALPGESGTALGRDGARAWHGTRPLSSSLRSELGIAALRVSPGGTARTGVPGGAGGARSGAGPTSRPAGTLRETRAGAGAPGALPALRRLFLRPDWPRRSPAGGHSPAGGGPPGTGTGAPCSRRPPRAAPGRQGRRGPGPSARLRPPAGGRAPVARSGRGRAARPVAPACGRGRRKMAAGRAAPLRSARAAAATAPVPPPCTASFPTLPHRLLLLLLPGEGSGSGCPG